ncbi:MAG TPA: ergothioneine biosynthesis protein EgtB, partial [Burkholderiales bacterium]|nr:ergothioneine biosynthesis protein EgtB [Burkholderiales bacterium]
MATIASRERGREQPRSDALLQRYGDVRAATLALCDGLSAEDCALQSMPDASPVKWHLAHTSWFFETFVLGPHAPGYRPFDPRFRVLYNSYYVQVGERHPRPERGLISRPSLEEIRAYRAHVDRAIERWAQSRTAPGNALDVLELGLHHEQQHQELILTDLKHLLSRNPLRPAYRAGAQVAAAAPASLQWIELPSGIREIGHDGAGFCFDNELPRHRVFVDGFRLASRPVTNAEYLAFMHDGGYERPQLWLSDGWDVCSAQRWNAPLYWERDDGRWRLFTLHG